MWRSTGNQLSEKKKSEIIIYNIPDEVTLENAEDIIYPQNSELALTKGDVSTKFISKTKRNARNLVIRKPWEERKS